MFSLLTLRVQPITLQAYGGMIAKMTGKSLPEEVTVRDLVLYSPSFESIKFDNHIITEFTTKGKVDTEV